MGIGMIYCIVCVDLIMIFECIKVSRNIFYIYYRFSVKIVCVSIVDWFIY